MSLPHVLSSPDRTSSSRIRLCIHAVLATAVLVVAVSGLGPVAAATAEGNYDAFTRADSVETVISNASIPTGIDIEGGGTATEARQTSFGVGDASAQVPYVGNTVPGLAGIGAALLGVPVPAYPLMAASTRGGAPQQVSYPGVTLSAESTDFSSVASAVLGQEASGSTASSQIDQLADGGVRAMSTAEVRSLQLGPYLTLSGVRTVAEVKAEGFSGEVTRRATTAIARITAPGLVLTLPESTPSTVPAAPGLPPPPAPPVLPIPGGGTRIKDPQIGIQNGAFTVTLPGADGPQTFPIPAQPVVDALRATGVTMTFQQPQQTKHGIVSGTYSFSYTVPEPPNNPLYNGPTKVTHTTGLALASVNFTAVPPESGSGFGDFPQADDATGGFTTDAGATGPLDGIPSGETTGAVPSAHTPVAAPPSVAGDQPMTGRVLRIGNVVIGTGIGIGIGDLYLAMVAIALFGYVSVTILRLMGVRFLWTS